MCTHEPFPQRRPHFQAFFRPTMTKRFLPAASPDQAFFTVSALEAGKIMLSETRCVTDADPNIVRRHPSLAFLLVHSVTGKRIVFDLGICKRTERYPPAIQKSIAQWLPTTTQLDVAASLHAGGLEPSDLDFVLFSHMHFDHTGDPTPFGRSTFLAGVGGRKLLQTGYPVVEDSIFDSRLLPADRTRWLDPNDGSWHPVGPFERALDFFGDGSLYIVDAPGHIAGHVNALVRVKTGWVYLAGDTAHDVRLMTGERQIAIYPDGTSVHEDVSLAAEHMRKVQHLKDDYGVPYILAHEFNWDKEHADAYFPGTLSL